jgi:SAM-dependent methyltransferase
MTAHLQRGRIISTLIELAHRYPPELREAQLRDVPRIAFHINLALTAVGSPCGRTICDIGGGIGLFSLGCAALGFARVILVDDFGDEINRQVGQGILALHHKGGVEVISRDVIREGIGALDGPLDVVTSFDSMEHWHHSPKRLFRSLVSMLSPHGHFILGVPNCANLRKHLAVLFGRASWSSMSDWYEAEVFRGHVREPDVNDLRYLAKDLGLGAVRILGRNWLGYRSQSSAVRLATAIFDRALRVRPSLCADIYLLAARTGAAFEAMPGQSFNRH